MKISIFSAFYPFRGGIAQFNASLFRALEKKNQVKAFTFKKQYPNFLFPGKSQFVSDNDVADKIPAERIVSTFNPFTYFKASRIIRKSEPDIFITNYWMSFFGIFMGLFSSKLPDGTKKVAIIHNLIPHEPRFFDKWLNRFFVKRYYCFVVMSDSVEKDVLSLKPKAKILRLNHPWYDHFGEKQDVIEARKKLNVDPNKKTLLFFGLIRDYKGLDILIEAFSKLPEDYQLIIAGEVYSNLKKYKDLISNSVSKDQIFFFNQYIPDSEVTTYFSAADVCVLPYRTATQSGITATSFHFEVPMIVTDVGGLKDIVGHDKMGLVIAEPDAVLLKNGILQYFEEGLKEKFSRTIKLEKENNSWANFADSVVLFAEYCKD